MDETFRFRVASLLREEPSILTVILDRLPSSDASRAVALAQKPALEVGHDLRGIAVSIKAQSQASKVLN
jgi:hypothetical protein